MYSEDNVIPNAGRYYRPTTPTKQKKDRQQEIQETLSQLPLIRKVSDHLQKQIEFFGSIDSVPIDLSADPTTHRNIMAANARVKAVLEKERSYLLNQVEKAAHK